MTRLCIMSGSWCMCFLLFFKITVISTRYDYNFYSTGFGKDYEYLLTTDTLEKQDEHRLQKRNIENNQNDSSPTPLLNNITTKQATHMYYNSTVETDPEISRRYWVDFNRSDPKIHWILPKSYRKASTVELSFEFPFYGHLIRNLRITSGGFLFTGDYVHKWLAATQYIAPLMANFGTNIIESSRIGYIDNGTAFTVEWKKIPLEDQIEYETFTFQTTLYKNGDIVFVYQDLPLTIRSIYSTSDIHPVRVGLSDAYVLERKNFSTPKTIHEYHRISFLEEEIRNSTVIYLKALPTCLQYKDCRSCVTSHLASFDCYWCPSINRCSTGLDRNRQNWLKNGCDVSKVSSESKQGCQ